MITQKVQSGELIKNLAKLHAKGYKFRGHASEAFILQPSAFRPDTSLSLMKAYGAHSKCHLWEIDQEKKKYYTEDFKLPLESYERVLWLTKYIMMYNYNLAKYYEDSIKQTPREDLKLDQSTQNYLDKYGTSHWSNENTFSQGVGYHLRALEFCLDVSGTKIIKKPEILNPSTAIFTMAQEMPFQHYDISTLVLDWTANPDVAIHFATHNIPADSRYLHLYAYKQIDVTNSQVLLGFESNEIKNERRERQEGCFTYFAMPWNFYYFHGRWPSIEDYGSMNASHFKIIRYEIANTNENRQYLKKMLDKKGITHAYLMNEGSMISSL